MDLSGKVALVTGGTMGIGAAISLELGRRGAGIALVARHDGPPARQVQEELQKQETPWTMITADLRNADQCQRAVESAVNHFGRLDVLVHNAGGPSPGKIDQITPQQWLETMDLHVNANFFLCQAALPHLRAQREGAIITVSSTAGIRGMFGAIAYATAKGAIPQFTRSLAREVADDNIRVNCVAPGVVRTRFHDDMTRKQKQLNLERRIPLHREGTPQQVADVVALLVTNDYITGETYVIDGGLTSRIA